MSSSPSKKTGEVGDLPHNNTCPFRYLDFQIFLYNIKFGPRAHLKKKKNSGKTIIILLTLILSSLHWLGSDFANKHPVIMGAHQNHGPPHS